MLCRGSYCGIVYSAVAAGSREGKRGFIEGLRQPSEQHEKTKLGCQHDARSILNLGDLPGSGSTGPSVRLSDGDSAAQQEG